MQYKICRKHLSRNMGRSFTQKIDVRGKKRVSEVLPPGGIYQQGGIDSNKKLNNNRSRRAIKYWGKIGRYHDWGKPRTRVTGGNVWEL